MLLLALITEPSEKIPPSLIPFDPETPQLGSKKTAKRLLTFNESIVEEVESRYITIRIL